MNSALTKPQKRILTMVQEARSCTLCFAHLPHGPNPVFRIHPKARIVIIGQAPGAKVHASGVPWQDDSGDHLLQWLGVDRKTFDDESAFALFPMGFCWPGRGKGGDLPPRPECGPAWHEQMLGVMPRLRLRLLVGQYAQGYYLNEPTPRTLTETVRNFEAFLPDAFPLPHPSWRSKLWMKKNPWFERLALLALRRHVRNALA